MDSFSMSLMVRSLVALDFGHRQHKCVTCRTLRQQRFAMLIFTENLVHCVNLTFYTMPNVYLLERPCGFSDSFMRWSGSLDLLEHSRRLPLMHTYVLALTT